MSLYDLVSDLQLTVDDLRFEHCGGRGRARASRARRRPSRSAVAPAPVVGEDVTYDAAEHDADRLPGSSWRRSWTLDSLLRAASTGSTCSRPASRARHAYRDYRRWAFESAALDLALQQAGRSLGDALGREARAARVRLLDPRRLARWLARALPRAALQARPDRRVDRRARRRARRRAATSRSST